MSLFGTSEMLFLICLFISNSYCSKCINAVSYFCNGQFYLCLCHSSSHIFCLGKWEHFFSTSCQRQWAVFSFHKEILLLIQVYYFLSSICCQWIWTSVQRADYHSKKRQKLCVLQTFHLPTSNHPFSTPSSSCSKVNSDWSSSQLWQQPQIHNNIY